jgi:hypothetical protein
MKRNLPTAAVLVIGVLLILQVSTFAKTMRSGHTVSGPITMQVWIDLAPTMTGLSATGSACFKLSGAVVDRGGAPTWSNATFTDTASPQAKCRRWEPSGAAIIVPPTAGSTLSSVYADGTYFGAKGSLYLAYAATYDLVKTFTGSGTWVITGGTGVYANAQGHGTFTANATKYPYQWADLEGNLRVRRG